MLDNTIYLLNTPAYSISTLVSGEFFYFPFLSHMQTCYAVGKTSHKVMSTKTAVARIRLKFEPQTKTGTDFDIDTNEFYWFAQSHF